MIEPRPGGPGPTGARATEAPELDFDEFESAPATVSRDPASGRHAWVIAGISLMLIGGAAGSEPIAILGIVLGGVGLLRWISQARGLAGLVVIRRLERERVVCGDRVQIVLTVRNLDPLPLPWLRIDEALPAELELAFPADATEFAASDTRTGARTELHTGWTLAPYRRITRRIQLSAGHRGSHRFDLVHVAAGDLLGRTLGDEQRSMPATLIVRPRCVATEALDARHDWNGERPTRTGRIDDPSRFAGVRPYAAGDPVRRIHWRATARLGEPVVKRFDPARERDVVIVLDIETGPPGRVWERNQPADEAADLLEELCIVAASLARRFEAEGAACGLAAASYTGSASRIAYAAPSSAPGQSGRLGDLLARLGGYPSAPFPALLGGMTRLARPGTQLVVVTAGDPRRFLAAARGLARSGFGV
ncbi:MAG: DUF58 domain-containing protein, partial [Candidatus Limnocylindrales bacterium]